MKGRPYKRVSRRGRITWSYCLEKGRDERGKRLRDTEHGFETKREAETALEAKRSELADPVPSAAAHVSLSDILKRYVDHCATVKKRAPKTIERYKELGEYLNADLLSSPLSKLSPSMFEEEYVRLSKSGGKRGGLGAKSVRHIHGLIHAALRKAVKWNLIARNPTDDCELPPLPPRKTRALDVSALRKLIEFILKHWICPIVRFATETGCRRGEILALTWPDIDFEQRTAHISKSLEQTREGLHLRPPKNGRTRDCRLSRSLVEALRNHRSIQDRDKTMFGAAYRHDLNLVFPSPSGDCPASTTFPSQRQLFFPIDDNYTLGKAAPPS